MDNDSIEAKALFYHLVIDHHVVSSDLVKIDSAALHEALHDLGHSEYRMPTHPVSYEHLVEQVEIVKANAVHTSVKLMMKKDKENSNGQ